MTERDVFGWLLPLGEQTSPELAIIDLGAADLNDGLGLDKEQDNGFQSLL